MNKTELIDKALHLEHLTEAEGLFLYENCSHGELGLVADMIRRKLHPDNIVTWQIDRNVNITNVCVSGCKFCGFHCRLADKERSYITSIDEYDTKIRQTIAKGGDQLLLQGGLHPHLDISYYESLFKELKRRFPEFKLHALGPPEIFYIAHISGISTFTTLSRLIDAGLDSLPGAGAEILDSELRREISPYKCNAEQWVDVMHEAHQLGLATSATMMYGHLETTSQRIAHIVKLRDLQNIKPEGSYGFIAFIPWPFCSGGTKLASHPNFKGSPPVTEYLKIIAISRIMLPNIPNIQASYLTVGRDIAKIALHCGANDLGSIMIEENVVASTGVNNIMDARAMQSTIRDAGFIPKLRDQKYKFRKYEYTSDMEL